MVRMNSPPVQVTDASGTVTANSADPVQRRHMVQWQAPKSRGTSRTESVTAPHMHCPFRSVIPGFPSLGQFT
jgi:hypothetical protein